MSNWTPEPAATTHCIHWLILVPMLQYLSVSLLTYVDPSGETSQNRWCLDWWLAYLLGIFIAIIINGSMTMATMNIHSMHSHLPSLSVTLDYQMSDRPPPPPPPPRVLSNSRRVSKRIKQDKPWSHLFPFSFPNPHCPHSKRPQRSTLCRLISSFKSLHGDRIVRFASAIGWLLASYLVSLPGTLL